jgi:hypothetical protein
MYCRKFLENSYFVRITWDKVTAGLTRSYIKCHNEQEKSPTKLELFKIPSPSGGSIRLLIRVYAGVRTNTFLLDLSKTRIAYAKQPCQPLDCCTAIIIRS